MIHIFKILKYKTKDIWIFVWKSKYLILELDWNKSIHKNILGILKGQKISLSFFLAWLACAPAVVWQSVGRLAKTAPHSQIKNANIYIQRNWLWFFTGYMKIFHWKWKWEWWCIWVIGDEDQELPYDSVSLGCNARGGWKYRFFHSLQKSNFCRHSLGEWYLHI